VDQPVVMIETEKTNTELPIPDRGRVAQLHGEVGDVIAVGAPLVTIQVPASPDGPASTQTHLVGQRPDMDAAADGGLSDVRRLPPKPQSGRVMASPAVRRLARELNVELRRVTGTGKGGVITKDDVDAASRRPHGNAAG
jgi:pyruvate/2-oxoglutarate dehydrogenase complex dihydrolipoamide acyltransferase (E2) component